MIMFQFDGLSRLCGATKTPEVTRLHLSRKIRRPPTGVSSLGVRSRGWERLKVEVCWWWIEEEEWGGGVGEGDVFCYFLCNLTKARRGNGG